MNSSKKFKYVVVGCAVLVATLFVVVVINDWARTIFHCEGFGCMGLGLLYLMISAVITVIFFICGFLFGPMPRLSSGLFAWGVSLVAMVLSFGVISLENQMQIEKDWKEYEEVCAQHPELCPK